MIAYNIVLYFKLRNNINKERRPIDIFFEEIINFSFKF